MVFLGSRCPAPLSGLLESLVSWFDKLQESRSSGSQLAWEFGSTRVPGPRAVHVEIWISASSHSWCFYFPSMCCAVHRIPSSEGQLSEFKIGMKWIKLYNTLVKQANVMPIFTISVWERRLKFHSYIHCTYRWWTEVQRWLGSRADKITQICTGKIPFWNFPTKLCVFRNSHLALFRKNTSKWSFTWSCFKMLKQNKFWNDFCLTISLILFF